MRKTLLYLHFRHNRHLVKKGYSPNHPSRDIWCQVIRKLCPLSLLIRRCRALQNCRCPLRRRPCRTWFLNFRLSWGLLKDYRAFQILFEDLSRLPTCTASHHSCLKCHLFLTWQKGCFRINYALVVKRICFRIRCYSLRKSYHTHIFLK